MEYEPKRRLRAASHSQKKEESCRHFSSKGTPTLPSFAEKIYPQRENKPPREKELKEGAKRMQVLRASQGTSWHWAGGLSNNLPLPSLSAYSHSGHLPSKTLLMKENPQDHTHYSTKTNPRSPGVLRVAAGRKQRGEETKAGRIAWLLTEVTLVDSTEGVWCNWEMWRPNISPCSLIWLRLCLVTTTLSKNILLQTRSNVPTTLTRAKWCSGQSTDAVPGSISLQQR